MDEGKEWMIRFANRMIPSGLDGFAGWNRMNPLGLGWIPAEFWMIRMK